jgi:hypothetical protein
MVGVATFERGRIRERQLDGIAKAKAAGKYRGRKPRAITIEAVNALKARGLPMAKIAKELNCGGRGPGGRRLIVRPRTKSPWNSMWERHAQRNAFTLERSLLDRFPSCRHVGPATMGYERLHRCHPLIGWARPARATSR